MSMADRDGYIWYDGKLVPWRSATTHVLTHSLHYGLAVFEGIRAYNTVDGTAVFRLPEHIDRLYNSAHIYMKKTPPTPSGKARKRSPPATTRACCSTSTASSPKARARTCSWSRTAASTSRS